VNLRTASILCGALFGFALGWARLWDHDVLLAMLRLQQPDVFLIMGAAVGTAAIGARLLRAAGARAVIGGAPVSWRTLSPTRDHVIGSAMFGLGWSVSCACPGPIAIQVVTGHVSGLFTAVGLMCGILLRDLQRERAARAIEPGMESIGLPAPESTAPAR